MVLRIFTTAPDTIVVFFVQIEFFKTYKMITKRNGKYAALENFQGPHNADSTRKSIFGIIWSLES